jgi:hypothetical protein
VKAAKDEVADEQCLHGEDRLERARNLELLRNTQTNSLFLEERLERENNLKIPLS